MKKDIETVTQEQVNRWMQKRKDVSTIRLAGTLYDNYCMAVGGCAWNGDNLPTWDEFRGDETKNKQSDAWIQVAIVATEELTTS